MALDIQNAPNPQDAPPIPEGYHKLAALMSKSRRMTIFRRFGKLTMVNLLDLQAELADLEERYQLIYGADSKSNDPARTCLSKKFSALRDSERSDVKIKLTIDLGYIPPGPKILRLRRRSCQVGLRSSDLNLDYAKVLSKLGAGTFFSPPQPRTEDFQIAYLYIETNMHLLGSPSSIYCNFQNSKRRRIDEVIQDRSQGSFSRSENRFSRF